jgi:hypothetical protein
MRRAQLLRQLVLDSQYVIDEELIAAAILARNPQVRSFRPSRQARSFRPCNLQSPRGPRPLNTHWHRG